MKKAEAFALSEGFGFLSRYLAFQIVYLDIEIHTVVQ